MKLATLLNILVVTGLASAVPRKRATYRKRQAASCSCPADVIFSQTSIATVTLITTNTATTTAQGATVTVSRITTLDAGSVFTSTATVAPTTVTRTGSATTVTVTSTNRASTVTTCIISAYKHKRQASASLTSAPSATTLTTDFGIATAEPARCVCRLISAYGIPTSTSTSPTNACSCAPVQTTTRTVFGTVTVTRGTTALEMTTSSASTEYEDDEITTTRYTTVTVNERTATFISRTTDTVTTTVNPTRISCPTADLSCDNQGVRWAIYRNTNSAGVNNTNRDSSYSSFNPALFKTRQPMYQNVTYTLGGFNYPASRPVIISFYNSTPKFESDYITINHVGYVFAQVTGTYTFSISKSDDITLLWVGDNAYSGYTRANANIDNTYGEATSTYRVNFVKGEYYPFRIIFGNAQEAIVFQASLTAPDGRVILTSNSKASPYLVQNSCDGTSAPAFAPFGSET